MITTPNLLRIGKIWGDLPHTPAPLFLNKKGCKKVTRVVAPLASPQKAKPGDGFAGCWAPPVKTVTAWQRTGTAAPVLFTVGEYFVIPPTSPLRRLPHDPHAFLMCTARERPERVSKGKYFSLWCLFHPTLFGQAKRGWSGFGADRPKTTPQTYCFFRLNMVYFFCNTTLYY